MGPALVDALVNAKRFSPRKSTGSPSGGPYGFIHAQAWTAGGNRCHSEQSGKPLQSMGSRTGNGGEIFNPAAAEEYKEELDRLIENGRVAHPEELSASFRRPGPTGVVRMPRISP